jgi:hypothetical protein
MYNICLALFIFNVVFFLTTCLISYLNDYVVYVYKDGTWFILGHFDSPTSANEALDEYAKENRFDDVKISLKRKSK